MYLNKKESMVLRKSNEDSEFSSSFRWSIIQKPTSKNWWERLYIWFLFRFESEFSYLILTLLFSSFPILLMTYFVANQQFSVLPLVNASQWIMINDSTSGTAFNGVLYDIILRNAEWYLISTVFIFLLPIRKDFSIIYEARSFMIILVISSISRNLIEIFVNNGTAEIVANIDSWLFYLQTIVFLLSVIVSFIYPVLIKTQIIIPLPSVPERIYQLQTAILEPRGFKAFYEWLESYFPKNIKYLDCYWRIRFYK